MLKMILGAKVNCADKISEGYHIEDKYIHANVNCDNIEIIIKEFIKLDKGPYFLFLEVPLRLDEEKSLQNIEDDSLISSFHKNVYYLDNMSPEMALKIFDDFKEILINDGISSFGFGNHLNKSEIMKNKYNVVSIYCAANDINKYTSMLENNNIRKDYDFKTAWDYFTEQSPGDSYKIENENGETIFTVIESLKELGLYLAEIREEK